MRKSSEQSLFLFELYSKSLNFTKKELYKYFLSQAVQKSGSSIGFFHFVSEDQKEIELTTWNDEALKNCVADYETHYPIAQAGNWVDCVVQKKPIIYNDFPNSPNQKGLPKGHVAIKRFMSIPIVENGKVRIIFGVGNKVQPYKQADAIQIHAIATELFKIIKKRDLEEALQQSEQKYRALVENAGDAIVLVDLKGSPLYRNPPYYKQLGLKEGESVDFAKIHPEDLPAVREKNAELINTGSSTSEYRVKHHDGYWVHRLARNTLLYDQSKKPIAILSIIRDITQQKEAEAKLRENQEKIEAMNEKLRVVGSLTRHDVRNKLSNINAFSYVLKKRYADKPDLVETLQKIEQSVKDSAKIFDFAKMYEEIGAQQLVYVDVEKALNEARALFSGPLPTITNNCHGLQVLADSFLRQLFYNFIDNTLKHGKKATEIQVYFEEEKTGDLRLVYQDNGVGVTDENKRSLFKQGYSTAGSTGFGLFLTKRMIDVYGWSITEEGQNGEGVKFVIAVPQRNKNGQVNYSRIT